MSNDKSNSETALLESGTGVPGTSGMTNELIRNFGAHQTPTGLGLRPVAPVPVGMDMLALPGRLFPTERSTSEVAGGLVRGVPLAMLTGADRTGDAEVLADDPNLAMGLGGGLSADDEARASSGASAGRDANAEIAELLCPLCRGKVFGWKVIEPARHQLNRKPRGCAQEACGFTGTYKELREHARSIHPSARPSDIDPARQRDWRRLERQRDLGDVLSTIRSAMPGATVLGDYVIDDDEEEHEDEGDESDFPGDDGNWWTVFLLFQVFGPAAPFASGRGLQGRPSRLTRGPPGSALMRGALWGENFQGSGLGGGVGNVNGSNVNVEGGLGGSTSRRRSRRPRSRGDIL
jgi:hypothetical protein